MRSTCGTSRLRCVPPTPARVRRLTRRSHPTPSVRLRGIRFLAQRADWFDIATRPDVRIIPSVGALSFHGSCPQGRW